MIKTLSLGLFSVLLCIVLASAMEERVERGAVLELKNHLWVGAGQAGITGFDGFENYWNCAPEGKKPNVFMDYYDTWNMNDKWSHELKQELLKFHRQGFFVVPQIGLNLFYLWQQYLDGSQDDELENFIKGLKHLAIPAFIRIGYEFNCFPGGLPVWSAEQFKQVYNKIAGKIKASGLEIACIWNCSLSGWSGIGPYYPGNQNVDWVGFNCFSGDIAGGNHATMRECIGIGDRNGKPTMIGEASPNRLNVVNYKDWGLFCGVYFPMIARERSIKQMCYINWDWDIQDMIGGNGMFPWGDARLQMPGSYKNRFFQEMSNSRYFHAASEKETRALMFYDDKEAPEQIKNLTREGRYLTWDAVKDRGTADLAHYIIYKNGKLWDYTIDPQYEISGFLDGSFADVSITAMDRAGNESKKSEKLRVRLDQEVELIWDGQFDYPATSAVVDWKWVGSMDGDAKPAPDDIVIDDQGKLDGKNSCILPDYQISGVNQWWKNKPPGAKDWKIQLFQCFQVEQGKEYTISFKAVAKAPRTIKVYFMDHHIRPQHTHIPSNGSQDPNWDDREWEYYKIWDANIETSPKTFTYKAKAPVTETARLSFMMGKCEPTTIWIDAVSVKTGGPTNINDEIYFSTNNNHMNLQANLDRAQNRIHISYSLPKKSLVGLTLFNSAGKLIKNYVNQNQTQGDHQLQVSTKNLATGVYVVKLQAGNSVNSQRVLLCH